MKHKITTRVMPAVLMKTLINAILILLVTMATFSVYGGDTIEEAFNMKLGAFFAPSITSGTSHLTNGIELYQFAHSNETGFKVFTTYFVRVTPKSHKIYSIIAEGNVTNRDIGLAQQLLIMQLLNLKYQGVVKLKEVATNSVARIDQGSRHVLTQVHKAESWMIEIQYYDADLEKAAAQETSEMKKEK